MLRYAGCYTGRRGLQRSSAAEITALALKNTKTCRRNTVSLAEPPPQVSVDLSEGLVPAGPGPEPRRPASEGRQEDLSGSGRLGGGR